MSLNESTFHGIAEITPATSPYLPPDELAVGTPLKGPTQRGATSKYNDGAKGDDIALALQERVQLYRCSFIVGPHLLKDGAKGHDVALALQERVQLYRCSFVVGLHLFLHYGFDSGSDLRWPTRPGPSANSTSLKVPLKKLPVASSAGLHTFFSKQSRDGRWC